MMLFIQLILIYLEKLGQAEAFHGQLQSLDNTYVLAYYAGGFNMCDYLH